MADSEGGSRTRCLGCSDPPSARTFSFPPTGGRRVGTGPSFRGRGGGWVVFSRSRSSAPVSRPTAVLIPPQVPLDEGRGRSWGERGGTSGARAASPQRRRSVAADVTARLAQRTQRRRHQDRAPAAPRPTCHQAQRLARRTSRCSPIRLFSGPASGVAGDRGDDLAGVERSKRSAASAATASSSRGLVHAQREGSKPAIPGYGNGPLP